MFRETLIINTKAKLYQKRVSKKGQKDFTD